MSSSLPVLTYFNARGRAELCRLLFAQAGVSYEDRRIANEDWPNLKADVPTHQLPMLEVDGVKICQSMAMARYVAAKYGLYEGSELVKARIDMICDTFEDILQPFGQAHFEEDKELKEKKMKKATETSDNFLKVYEELLAESGTGFFVGTKLTMADICIMNLLQYLNLKEQAGPLVKKHMDMVINLPRIKAWISKRPETER